MGMYRHGNFQVAQIQRVDLCLCICSKKKVQYVMYAVYIGYSATDARKLMGRVYVCVQRPMTFDTTP